MSIFLYPHFENPMRSEMKFVLVLICAKTYSTDLRLRTVLIYYTLCEYSCYAVETLLCLSYPRSRWDVV